MSHVKKITSVHTIFLYIKKNGTIQVSKLKYLYPARYSKKISEKSGPNSLLNVSNVVGVNLLTRSRLVLSHFRE